MIERKIGSSDGELNIAWNSDVSKLTLSYENPAEDIYAEYVLSAEEEDALREMVELTEMKRK